MFKQVEVKPAQYLKTKIATGGETIGPHAVRLVKGTVPEYIKLSPFQDLAWRTMGKYAKTKTDQLQVLDDFLLKAHMKIRPEEYLAYVLMTTLVAAMVGVVIAIVLGVVVFGLLGVGLVLRVLVAGLAMGLLPMMAYFMLLGTPGSRSKS